MDAERLEIYLNDHLAGSVAAVEVAERLAEDARGSPLGGFLARLLAEIREDQLALKAIIVQIGGTEHTLKKWMSWLGEKAGRMKPTEHVEAYRSLRILEELDFLALGVEGKRALWMVLGDLQPAEPRLAGPDFRLLAARAARQRDEIETFRRDAGRKAFLGIES